MEVQEFCLINRSFRISRSIQSTPIISHLLFVMKSENFIILLNKVAILLRISEIICIFA